MRDKTKSRKRIDRLMQASTAPIQQLGIDQHDGKDSIVSFLREGERHTGVISDPLEFITWYRDLISGPIGIEATAFNYIHGDRPIFLEQAARLKLAVHKTPSNSVARYRSLWGLQKDETTKDAEILSRLLGESKHWQPMRADDRPCPALMTMDAKIGRLIVDFRDEKGGFPEEWASFLPEVVDVPANYAPYLVDAGSYRKTALPFAYLASEVVKAGMTKNDFKSLGRLHGFRYKGKNQSGLPGVQGSCSIFGSLFYHELVRGAFNRQLGLSHRSGQPAQVKALGNPEIVTAQRKEHMNGAKNAILWIWHRAVETNTFKSETDTI